MWQTSFLNFTIKQLESIGPMWKLLIQAWNVNQRLVSVNNTSKYSLDTFPFSPCDALRARFVYATASVLDILSWLIYLVLTSVLEQLDKYIYREVRHVTSEGNR